MYVVLVVFLVLSVGFGMGMMLGVGFVGFWIWKNGIVGMVVGVFIVVLVIGGCSWWLIGL